MLIILEAAGVSCRCDRVCVCVSRADDRRTRTRDTWTRGAIMLASTARFLARRLPRSRLGGVRAYSGHGIVPPAQMGLELRRRVAAMEGLFREYT